jgi:hypothetical protein
MVDEDLVTMIYIVAYSISNSIMIILFGFGFRNEMNIWLFVKEVRLK